MTIKKRLYLSGGILAIILIGLGIYTYITMNKTWAHMEEIRKYQEIQSLIDERILDHYRWVQMLAVDTILLKKEFTGELDYTKCRLGHWYYSFKPPDELSEVYKKIEEPHMRLHASASRILSAIKRGDNRLARNILDEETFPSLAGVQMALNDLRTGMSSIMEKRFTELKANERVMTITSITVYTFIIIIFFTGSFLFFINPMQRSLRKISEWINYISSGDLTKKFNLETQDEIARMAEDLQKMIEEMKKIIIHAIEASKQVSAASEQIAVANQNFTEKIGAQAASIEETSSTMEEMTASIKQVADNVAETNSIAQRTAASAEEGIKTMADTIRAIEEINNSSIKVSGISNIIEEIAFQTNLLALNAAVEAARAGEHGKGFAVVASEIRSLAQKTSESAKEITSLIKEGLEKSAKGVQLANELNKKLTEIVSNIKKVATLMEEVTMAIREQTSGINQINLAISQIDQTTQQNASLIEETSAAAEELSAQAKDLLNIVSLFNVNEDYREIKKLPHPEGTYRKRV